MNLNQMVMESLAKMESEGKVQEIVEKHVESTVNDVVKDLFGSWSDFSKDLKKQAKEALQINFKDLNLPTYNHLILQAIKDKLDDEITTNGVNQIKQQIEGLLSDSKREYKLSELVNELREEIGDLDELGYEDYHEMTLHVDDSYGSYWIGLDSRNDVSEYDCKYRLLVNSEGEICSVKINDKESYSRKNINEFDIKAVLKGLHGLEETLFKIYVSGAKLIVDEDKCELEISNPEYD
ncbi:hypothetical protein [Heyndrickxia oleronia]|uniref:hypothetical protein n=1 Tax=Heyndrickxia oleronia TaxID=38875 RepID=UPI001B0237B5|nr:hypothetical protein [Heyndrickxia oleronia]GIN39022.1 hypothetical protein J19TS1_19710 [Heyndrickxia oleronia]